MSNLQKDWQDWTPARVGLKRFGHGLSTQQHLAFQADCAAARDAVWAAWPIQQTQQAILDEHPNQLMLHLKTLASTRHEYLLRPDLGRQLSPASAELLVGLARPDLLIVLSNGLSSLAVQQHGAKLTSLLLQAFQKETWQIGPVCLVPNARVATGDEIGERIGARMVLVLVGERPGLSASDGIGAYLTYSPRIGTTDERRNCVSNIRPAGLDLEQAVAALLWLIRASFQRQLSGVQLKFDGTALGETPEKGLGE